MSKTQQKVIQYLDEARASELALVRDLQSQISIAPRGSYRSLLEQHLRETRDHAERLRKRLTELDQGSNPLDFVAGAAQKVVGQALSIGKAPLALVRGASAEEKILKNAKDACASEALEIATYIAIERLANAVGDSTTAKLAVSIRGDEEKMLEAVRRELPKLTDAVVGVEIDGRDSYDLSQTGAADAARDTADEVKSTARTTATRAKRTARKVPGAARAEGQVRGTVASEDDLPIADYDDLTADEIVGRLPQLSQVDLEKVAAYEHRQDNRTTVNDKIDVLRGDEPWAGYHEQTVDEIVAKLSDADDNTVREVRAYESAHKNRASVMKVTARKVAGVS